MADDQRSYSAPISQRLGLPPRGQDTDTPARSAVNVTKSIRELAGRTALWRQPSQLRQEFELVVGDEIVATLRWRKNVGSAAVARAPDGTWSFKAAGFLNPRVTIRLPNSDYDFAVFRPGNTGTGILEAMAEQRFHWRCVNFWQNAWAFFDHEGERLLTIRPDTAATKLGGIVTVEPKASTHHEISYLVILSWYLLVLMAEDAAAGQPITS